MMNSQSLPISLVERDLSNELARRSYYEFLIQAFAVLEPSEPFITNWHVEYLCSILQAEAVRIANRKPNDGVEYIIINIPPRSLKTKIVTTILNAWVWLENPHLDFISASYSSDLAIEHAVDTRKLIQSEWYQQLLAYVHRKNPAEAFKLSVDQNVKSRFSNDKSGQRRATSVGGTVTGAGADIIVIDDPLSVSQAGSEAERKTANDWITKTMYSRLNNQRIGIRIVVMQRLHEDDPTGFLLSSGMSVRHICIPAEDGDNINPPELRDKYTDGLFFPARFDKTTLLKTKVAISSLGYTGQYLQRPAPAEGEIIKSHWFGRFYPNDLIEKNEKGEDKPLVIVKKYYTDGAYGKEQSDNTATICYSVRNGHIYIWSIAANKLPFPEFIKAYKQFLEATGYSSSSICRVEPKAIGISAVQQLKIEKLSNGGNINIIEDVPPTESKYSRVLASTASIEAGYIHLLANAPWIDAFLFECTQYPNGKHDDQVDGLAAIIRIECGKPEPKAWMVNTDAEDYEDDEND